MAVYCMMGTRYRQCWYIDNDAVLATGEEEGNGDSFTHSMYGKSAQLLSDIIVYYYNIFILDQLDHTAVSPYALPCFGCNALVSIVLTVSTNIWSR